VRSAERSTVCRVESDPGDAEADWLSGDECCVSALDASRGC
jgi:hypothetical protein